MKIVCDNCATKYSIADEKVRGKVFKIRCKKCSHIIVVRGGADGNASASTSAEQAPIGDAFPGAGEEAPTTAARGGAAAATGDSVWHLVIDREQVGPMTAAEVRQKFSEGAIDVETYAWREGFGDWLRLGSIDDFRDLGGAAPADEGATRRTDSADLFAAAGASDDSAPAPSEGASGDIFGGGGGAAAPAYAAAPSEDVFGGGGGGGGALFSAPSAAPAPARAQRTSSPGFAASAAAEPAAAASDGGRVDVRPMTGQRNENSVLFSLNNLQALATGGGGAKAAPAASGGGGGGDAPRPGFASSQTEGSGLIDIRAMAASTLAASPASGGPSGLSKPDELPGLGAAPVFSPMAAPILMPSAPSGPPKWMWGLLAIGGLALIGIIVVGVLLLTRKPEVPPMVATAAPGAAPAGTAPAGAAPAGTAPAGAAPAAAPAAAAPAAAAPAAGAPVAANDAKESKHHKGSSGTKLAKNEAKPEAAAPAAAAPAAAAPAPTPKKSGKHDELDDLLNGASPGDTPKPAKKSRASDDEGSSAASAGALDNVPEQLDKQQIVGGMGKIKGRVAACYDQYKVPGMANVSVTINNNGHVGNASVGGAFAGTPTGDCVSRAVKSATFPRFKGSAQTINYPFILR